jgi:hypothetical protein
MTGHHLRNTRGRKRVENYDTQSKLGLSKVDNSSKLAYYTLLTHLPPSQ